MQSGLEGRERQSEVEGHREKCRGKEKLGGHNQRKGAERAHKSLVLFEFPDATIPVKSWE